MFHLFLCEPNVQNEATIQSFGTVPLGHVGPLTEEHSMIYVSIVVTGSVHEV